jgi:GTPase Era involved in 16S rRNA processing
MPANQLCSTGWWAKKEELSLRPQTTRFKILGIVNRPDGRLSWSTLPASISWLQLNRRMMAGVHDALLTIELVCLIHDTSVSRQW